VKYYGKEWLDNMDIENFVSGRVKAIELSSIRRFSNLVSTVPGALSLTLGQPDFNTPENIKIAGIKAIVDNHTTYTHNQGYKELRLEIANFLNKHYNLYYDSETEITVTIGASQAIDIVMRTLINEGDEVLIPSPGYVAYGACVTLSGGKPVYIPTFPEDNFKLKTDAIKKYITPKTKILILSYPCNPTGATMDAVDLLEISTIIKENNILVISDEVYSELTYGKKHTSIASIQGMKEYAIVINGFSKAYSMTGWRLGYAAAPASLMKHLVKTHQYNVSCASAISQMAGIEALKNGDGSIQKMVAEYNLRRQYCYSRIKVMGLKCFEPTGAFYLFPEIKKFGLSSEEFCIKLLYNEKLALVPGSAFGTFGEGYIRMSYAYSMDILEEGLNRLETFIKSM
jgi:aminotransferase